MNKAPNDTYYGSSRPEYLSWVKRNVSRLVCGILSSFLRHLKRYFTESLSTVRVTRKRKDKAGSSTVGGRDLVQFKLELMPNHQNSHLENTGIRSTRYLDN